MPSLSYANQAMEATVKGVEKYSPEVHSLINTLMEARRLINRKNEECQSCLSILNASGLDDNEVEELCRRWDNMPRDAEQVSYDR